MKHTDHARPEWDNSENYLVKVNAGWSKTDTEKTFQRSIDY